MIPIKKLIVLSGFQMLFLGLVSGVFGAQADWKVDLQGFLQHADLQERISRDNFNKNERAYVRDMTQALELEERCTAILAIWFFADDSDSLELAWWRSQDPVVRGLIVAVFLAMRLEPISGVPPFEKYANRFADDEKRKRLSEIRWVVEIATRKAIAKEIHGWATRNLGPILEAEFAAKKMEAYRRMAELP